jgi:ABC-type thiamin/hydroxymethylpyrimidine transport system permease subunit
MNQNKNRFYFTTRELIMMAAFAAVGGIASSYINMVGDFFQSFLGFAGTTQWAAGLHVVWIMLAAVIIRKPGSASTAGILKGAVEFFSGNTHGILVVIIDIFAGLLIDLIFRTNKKKIFNVWFYLAAGIASVSNIFIFQIFASVPSDILTLVVIGAASLGAFISGIIFGGILVRSIYKAVQKAGLIQEIVTDFPHNNIWPTIITAISLASMLILGIIYFSQQGINQEIQISGDVDLPYELNSEEHTFEIIEVKTALNDIERSYQGIRISDIIDKSLPRSKEGLLLIRANDGYSYFLTLEEVFSNEELILSSQNISNLVTMNVIGASNQKAWIRGVSELIVTEKEPGIDIVGNVGQFFTFLPQDWQLEMDSFYMNTALGSKKLQGVPLFKIITQTLPNQLNYQVEITSFNGDKYSISFQELPLLEDSVLIFVLPTETSIEFILGNVDGEVFLNNVTQIKVN